MATRIALTILILGLVTAHQLTKGRSEKQKYVIWGTMTMIVIAPYFSWLIGISYSIIERSGWAGVTVMSVMFPIVFIVGIIILLIGIFK